jgi:mannose-1-phosphate guanylyltransferase/phosphomannomutase
MQALILAAGEGTRLRPLTLDRPKPMLPVGGRPVLEHLVHLLRYHGIGDIAINLHYKPEAIVQHFGDGRDFGVSITYSYEEQLLGSAGAARQLDWFLTEPFIVLYGDVLTDLNLTRLADWHQTNGGVATLALYEVEDPTRCGVVELDPSGRIERFIEKPAPEAVTTNLANAGIYVLDPGLLGLVAPHESADFGRDLFPAALRLGLPMYGRLADGYVLDMGSIERYTEAEVDLRAGRFRPSVSPTISVAGVGEGVTSLC